jgi:hypothetical protein
MLGHSVVQPKRFARSQPSPNFRYYYDKSLEELDKTSKKRKACRYVDRDSNPGTPLPEYCGTSACRCTSLFCVEEFATCLLTVGLWFEKAVVRLAEADLLIGWHRACAIYPRVWINKHICLINFESTYNRSTSVYLILSTTCYSRCLQIINAYADEIRKCLPIQLPGMPAELLTCVVVSCDVMINSCSSLCITSGRNIIWTSQRWCHGQDM